MMTIGIDSSNQDRDTIANGLWLNDNIMIHVGQNMSTLSSPPSPGSSPPNSTLSPTLQTTRFQDSFEPSPSLRPQMKCSTQSGILKRDKDEKRKMDERRDTLTEDRKDKFRQ